MEEKKDQGFTIKDKRIFSFESNSSSKKSPGTDDTAVHNNSSERTELNSGVVNNAPPLPEISFSTFIISLSSSVLFHMGEIPDPITNMTQRNLPLAKQTIDILAILKQKTVGNLTNDEAQLLENLLYDLRIRYVEEIKK